MRGVAASLRGYFRDAGITTCATAQEAAETLVRQALENAGRDNVTVVVIEVHAVGDSRDTRDQAALAEPQAAEPSLDTAEIPQS